MAEIHSSYAKFLMRISKLLQVAFGSFAMGSIGYLFTNLILHSAPSIGGGIAPGIYLGLVLGKSFPAVVVGVLSGILSWWAYKTFFLGLP